MSSSTVSFWKVKDLLVTSEETSSIIHFVEEQILSSDALQLFPEHFSQFVQRQIEMDLYQCVWKQKIYLLCFKFLWFYKTFF